MKNIKVISITLGTQTLAFMNLNPYEECIQSVVLSTVPYVNCFQARKGYSYNVTLGNCELVTLNCGDITSNNLFKDLNTCQLFCKGEEKKSVP